MCFYLGLGRPSLRGSEIRDPNVASAASGEAFFEKNVQLLSSALQNLAEALGGGWPGNTISGLD